MRILARNSQKIEYKTYLGRTQKVDSNGLKTGQYEKTYSSLKTEMMNISPVSGNATLEMFGDATNYSLVALTCNMSCDLDEDSIVWINRANTLSHNYVVLRVSKSLNNIAYALKEVDTSKVPTP